MQWGPLESNQRGRLPFDWRRCCNSRHGAALRGVPASTGGSLDALSNQLTNGRALATTGLRTIRREGSATGVIAAAAVGLILAMMSVDAALQGPWLDEFWTLELSDTSRGLLPLARDRWLSDVHPPVFNLWATFLTSIGVTSIPAGRLASNLPAAGLMILAAVRLSRRMPEQAGFNAALLLLVLSLGQSLEAFANYRSYFWQIAALTTLVFVARHVASTRADLDRAKDSDLGAIAVLATAGSIGLHYIGGLFGGLLAGAIGLSALARGHRRWAALMLTTAGLASLFVLAAVLLQARKWAAELDHSWIDPIGLEALAVPFALAAGAACQNPVPLVGLWRGRRSGSQGLFLAMIVAVLAVGVAIVLVINAYKPIVVDRYLFSVPVLVSAIMAVPAARLARDRALFGLFALVAVAMAASPLVRSGIKPLWREGAETIAEITAGCPGTQVYAASGWALGPAAETRAALREDPIFKRAYNSLAQQYGYTVQFVGQNGSIQAAPGACPLLLWYEHTPNDAENDLPWALSVVGLTGLEGARVSAIRSPTGFVVRIDRP